MNILKQRLIDIIYQQPDEVSAETLLQMISATLIKLQSGQEQSPNVMEPKQLAWERTIRRMKPGYSLGGHMPSRESLYER
ncbi:hypothetical protein THII_2006 [Thioploca ingrica]|uniref:Uncharacterized protein n=1 Tax=Thioploca ingrica TaxID=40754 RepID=A0A090AEC8_9GAMM|nr:hypothetical protein THII_2006 [Thioploca ingrica]